MTIPPHAFKPMPLYLVGNGEPVGNTEPTWTDWCCYLLMSTVEVCNQLAGHEIHKVHTEGDDVENNDIPGWAGTMGPFRYQYGKPHVYARDVLSGAGNCVCGNPVGEARHVQAAPGVPVPDHMRAG